jgi:hypothetical protein
MKFVDFFFDYIYYRMNKFYFKWDGRNGITSVIGVSMIQCLVLFDLLFFIERIFYTKQQIVASNTAKAGGYIGIACLTGLIIYNYFKYYGKYNSFKSRWKNETNGERNIRGVLVLLCLVFPWVPMILMGIF